MKEEINKILWDHLTNDINLNLSKLPIFLKETLEKFLIPLNRETTKSALTLILLSKLSQMLWHYRLKVSIDNNEVPCNLYSLIILWSWEWKDRTISQIEENLLKYYSKTFDEDNKKQYEEVLEEVKKEAEDKHWWKKSVMNEYIKRNEPRELIKEIARWTLEWIMSQRDQLQKLDIWSTFVHIKEYWSFLKTLSKDDTKREFIEIIIELFDLWNYWWKSIKWEKKTWWTKWIPNNFIAHTSFNSIINPQCYEMQLEYNRLWFARRSLFCLPNKDEIVDKIQFNSLDEKIKYIINTEKNVYKEAEDLSKYFLKAFQAIKPTTWFWVVTKNMCFNSVYKLTDESFYTYQVYKELCFIRSNELVWRFKNDEWFKWEIKNRYWKAIKLAWIIACINHPDIKTVEKQDVLQAVYLIEYFWQHFIKLYHLDLSDDISKLYDLLKEKEFSKFEIRSTWIIQWRNFKSIFESMISEIEELCTYKWDILIKKTHKNNLQTYQIVSKKQEDSVINPIINYSSTKQQYHDWSKYLWYVTEWFEDKQCEFNTFHNVVFGNECYSANQYHTWHRLWANSKNNINLIILDVDNEFKDKKAKHWIITIEEAKEIFKNYYCLLVPTKSHQKWKPAKENKEEQPPIDRFRIILSSNVVPNDKYKNVLKWIIKQFNLKWIDWWATDNARFFYPSTHWDHYYTWWNKTIDYNLYYEEEKIYVNTIVNNSVDKPNLAQWFDFNHYQWLGVWDKKRINCPYHQDNTASAFISRSDKTLNLYIHCSACNNTWWEK